MSAAVTGKAEFLHFSVDGPEVRFRFNSPSYERDELENLLSYRFYRAGQRADLRNLALAVTAADQVAERVDFYSTRFKLTLKDGELSVDDYPSGGLNEVVVLRPTGFLARFLGRAPNLRETLTLCSHARLQLRDSTTDELLSRSYYNSDAFFFREFVGPDKPGRMSLSGVRQLADSGGSFSGALLVVDRNGGALKVVVEGISHQVELEQEYLGGIIWNESLALDLSGTGLVRDQRFEEMLAKLLAHLPSMVLERVRAEATLARGERAVLERLLPQALDHYRAQGDQEAVNELESWLKAGETPLDFDDAADFRLLLERLKHLQEMGETARARALAARVGEKIRAKLQEANWAGNYEQLVAQIRRLEALLNPGHIRFKACIILADAFEGRPLKAPEPKQDRELFDCYALALRYQGRRSEAESAYQQLAQTASARYAYEPLLCQAEVMLSREDMQQAQQLLLGQPENLLLLEFAADCHELLERYQEAYSLRCRALKKGESDRLLCYQLQLMCARSRGQMSLLDWVRLHLETLKSDWRARSAEKKAPSYARSTRQKMIEAEELLLRYLKGQPQPFAEPLKLLTEKELEHPSLALYFQHRVAHQLRSRGHLAEAENMLNRLRLERRLTQAVNGFLYSRG